MIKAIIFDCYGVLTEEVWVTFRNTYLSTDILRNQAKDILAAHHRGMIDYDEFLSSIATLAGLKPKDVDAALSEKHGKNLELLRYIGTLKPHYKIGMLSNVGGDWLSEFLTPNERNLFDVVELSFESGIAKPDPRAYQRVAQKLEVDPEDCVFIDDIDTYCTAAKDEGMKAVRYQNMAQLKSELGPLLTPRGS